MLVTRTSMFTGVEHQLNLPVTAEQIAAHASGTYVQDAFPQLSAGHREFMMTGVTPEEWEALFGFGDDDEHET